MENQNKRRVATSPIREAVIYGSIYFILAFINLQIKLNLTSRWFDGTLERNHELLLAFQYANNEQSRLFQFFIPEALKFFFGLSTIYAYIVQRWLFIFLVFFCFHFFLKRWFDAKLAFAGVLFLAAIMPLSYTNDLQESTPLLLLTFLLALMAIREHRALLYMFILSIGVFNNETVLILPLVFFFYNFDSFKPRSLLQLVQKTLISSLPAFIIFGIIRYVTRNSPRLAPLWQLDRNLQGIMEQIKVSPLDYWRASFLFIFFLFGAFWLFAYLGFSKKPLFLQRASLMIPCFIAIHLLAGMINEVRLMLPLSFIIIPLALYYLFPINQEEQQHNRETSI